MSSQQTVFVNQVFCCLPYYHVRQLHCGAVVPMNITPYVQFEYLGTSWWWGESYFFSSNLFWHLQPVGPSGMGKTPLVIFFEHLFGRLWFLARSGRERNLRTIPSHSAKNGHQMGQEGKSQSWSWVLTSQTSTLHFFLLIRWVFLSSLVPVNCWFVFLWR